MAALQRFLRRLHNALRPLQAEPELARELDAHLRLLADDFERQGLTPAAALIAARRRFGSVEQAKDRHRDARSFVWIDDALCDLRYGWRLLRRAPGSTAVVVLTLALGIGAATLLFSIADGVLLRPLPWMAAERLVRITETRQGRTGRVAGTVSNGTFLAWRERASTLDGLGGWLTSTATLTGAGDPVRVTAIPTTPSLFRLLRVTPQVGRLFQEGEGAAGRAGVAILSYGLWQERFGGQADSLGRLIQLDGTAYTVVGVMPRDFAFPDREARLWTAWQVPPVMGADGTLRGVIFRAVARLRDGSTPEQAAVEATVRARSAPDLGVAARALFGAAGPIDVSAVPELQAMTAGVRPAILVLVAAALLLLVTATGNAASLQLARGAARCREIAVRSALGAGQHRIVRQLLVENGILGLCGGAAGVALAAALEGTLLSLLPAGFPRLQAIAIDARALVFALAASVLTSVLCGLLPAWQARRVHLADALSQDGAAAIGGGIRSSTGRLRALIMAAQVAIVCVLLVGAVLFTRSFAALTTADRGFDPGNVLTARLPLPPRYPAEGRQALLETLVARLRAVPGITHAAYGTSLPFVSFGGFTAFTMTSPRDPGVELNVQAAQRIVSPGYFPAMRLRSVAGRMLTDADTPASPPAVVVNRSFARQYLGDRPVGLRIANRGPRAGRIRFADEHAGWEVVGVVDDMRQEADAQPLPEIFASIRQVTPESMNGFEPILVIRTATDPTTFVSTLRSLVHQEAPALALDSVVTMEDLMSASLATPRLYAAALGGFAGAALLIAAVGLFGMLSFGISQRRREIGIRSALGAGTRDIVRLVLGQTLWIVGGGIVIGLAVALAGIRLLSAFLYGVSPYDSLTFVVVPIAIVVTSALACVVPARRAAATEPLVAARRG